MWIVKFTQTRTLVERKYYVSMYHYLTQKLLTLHWFPHPATLFDTIEKCEGDMI